MPSQTFTYSGNVQNFFVPAGVTSLSVDVQGARGGSGFGASGGRVQGSVPVTPGEELYIYVGGQAGWPNGGTGTGHNGGGSSDIWRPGSVRVAIAGGGGGSGDSGDGLSGGGGAGGPLEGQTGQQGYDMDFMQTGGVGGAGGTQSTGYAVGQGGPNIDDNSGAPGGCGGGGYYGGFGGHQGPFSAAAHGGGGGGGGSNYAIGTMTSPVHTRGFRSGNGQVILTWAGPVVQSNKPHMLI